MKQLIYKFMKKQFILNADDFGLNEYCNQAILEGYKTGFLKSASLCTNGIAFENAINEIISKCPDINLAVHLNIFEGKSLTLCPDLTDKNGYFNKKWSFFLLNSNNKNILEQIETEFNAQIKKAIDIVKINHQFNPC